MSDKSAPHGAPDLVRSVSFGSRVAEDESDDLSTYFVKTETWREVRDGEIDVVLAPKGGGKSAIYSMLLSSVDELFDEHVLLAPAENPTGAPAFELVAADDTSEAELVKIWKLYFLVLVADQLKDYGIETPSSKELYAILRDGNLLPDVRPRRTLLALAKDYVLGLLKQRSAEATMHLDPTTGAVTGVTGKIEFGEPNAEGRAAGRVSIESLYELAQQALSADGYTLWILLDRLDVAFASSPTVEKNALRALFRAYSDLAPYRNIHLKIFLRSDIWESITEDGFREASHIVRETRIAWDRDSLRQLVVRRLLNSEMLLRHYAVEPDSVLSSVGNQEAFFYQVFAPQVDAGSGKTATLDWAFTRTADGKGVTAPRELIHLFSEVRKEQIRRFETGQAAPTPPALFHPKAFDSALPAVSDTRLTKTIYAEFTDVKPWLEELRGQKGEHNVQSLARIWASDETIAESRAKRLVDIGFFAVRKNNYWIPFMYRPALGIVQGAAEGVRDRADDE